MGERIRVRVKVVILRRDGWASNRIPQSDNHWLVARDEVGRLVESVELQKRKLYLTPKDDTTTYDCNES